MCSPPPSPWVQPQDMGATSSTGTGHLLETPNVGGTLRLILPSSVPSSCVTGCQLPAWFGARFPDLSSGVIRLCQGLNAAHSPPSDL